MRQLLTLVIVFFFGQTYCAQGQTVSNTNFGALTWKDLPELPAAPGQERQHGLAGMFAGVHENVLILAGGANFPEALPWEGGKKVWWDDIFVLQKEGNKHRWLTGGNFKLPMALAYGVSISTPSGLLCIGGNNESGPQKDVFLLKWDHINEKIKLTFIPSLPFPLANATGAAIGNKVYIAGGENQEEVKSSFLTIDLADPFPQWKELKSWPGPPRSHAIAVSQSNGEYPCFFLFGGRQRQENGVSKLYSDGYKFDPLRQNWEKLAPIVNDQGDTLTLSAGTASPAGATHILLFGGVRGKLFNRLEHLQARLSQEDFDEGHKEILLAEQKYILHNHPGFSKEILSYNTITDSWNKLGELPFTSPVTTTAVNWEDKIILPSGEVSPGIRTTKLRSLNFEKTIAFGWVNYTVLGIYLGLLVLMGVVISGKQKSTQDFFKAGGRIPWWAAGVSIFGTQLSAITFMAIPAKTFATDWTLFFLLMTIILVAPIIILWFLPFFRRLNVTTAYEYLEMRYNHTVRLLGSIIYSALQLGRLGIVLLLPSLALSVVTGIDVTICILVMGLLSILYTVLGGIEAVIWTDVIQVFVLLGGAIVSLVFIYTTVDYNFSEIWFQLQADAKTKVFDFRFDFTSTTLWVVLMGGIAANIVQYGSDQTVIQRYLTTKDEKTAAQGILTGALMTLPSTFIFFSIGTALYLFYTEFPKELTPMLDNTDSVFPFYIATQLPKGISGLLIAAVFAAAMSSLDSSMNSVATVITTDFYHKLFPYDQSKKGSLKFAKAITVLVGVLGTAFAVMMANMGIPSLWDQFNMIVGLFAGGLGGIFLIGILSTKVNGRGALLGLLTSAVVQVLVKDYTSLSLHLYAFTGLTSAMIFTYVGSLIFREKKPKSIEGLTIHSLRKGRNKRVPSKLVEKKTELGIKS
jgi:SSS family solute:Na+ symporter